MSRRLLRLLFACFLFSACAGVNELAQFRKHAELEIAQVVFRHELTGWKKSLEEYGKASPTVFLIMPGPADPPEKLLHMLSDVGVPLEAGARHVDKSGNALGSTSGYLWMIHSIQWKSDSTVMVVTEQGLVPLGSSGATYYLSRQSQGWRIDSTGGHWVS